MHVEIVVPDLFWPDRTTRDGDRTTRDAYNNLPLPTIEKILARGRRSTGEGSGIDNWLMRYAPHAPTLAPTLAALRRAGEDRSINESQSGGHWLCADPCHLQVSRDTLQLTEAAQLTLSDSEAEAIVATLNQHFAQDQLQLEIGAAARWYLNIAQPFHFTAVAPYQARHAPLESSLPSGPDGARWRSWLNEVQMLLHQHPVNQARDARGITPINSVWLWGTDNAAADDTGPALRRAPARWVAGLPLARGIARSTRVPLLSLPIDASRLTPSDGVSIVVIDSLQDAVARRDLDAWRAALAVLERDWFAPLGAMLANGVIGMITVVALTTEGWLSVETTRADLRFFWRRPRSLGSYVASHVASS